MEIVCILILPGATILLIWVYRYQGGWEKTHTVPHPACQGRARAVPGILSLVSTWPISHNLTLKLKITLKLPNYILPNY